MQLHQCLVEVTISLSLLILVLLMHPITQIASSARFCFVWEVIK